MPIYREKKQGILFNIAGQSKRTCPLPRDNKIANS